MSEETRKVLEMFAEGKINPNDAERLLEKLTVSSSTQTAPTEKSEQSSETGGKRPRFLRIVVDKPGQDQVNIRMPLAFAGSGSRLLAVLPARVSEKLSELGVDLSALGSGSEKDWVEAIGNANIEVEKGNGKKVRIFCE